VKTLKIYGTHDEKTLQQMKTAMEHEAVIAGVLCADAHYGYGVPIGGVLAYEDHVSPSGVGFDIACGNKACLVDVEASYVRANIKQIMDNIWEKISFGIGRKNETPVMDTDLFDSDVWNLESTKPLRDKAMAQLGTVGSGNHYVDIMIDEMERVWVGVHFGSRGFGHGVATWFLKKCGASDNMDAVPLVLHVKSDLGEQYVQAMRLAGQYAYSGRDWVCEEVARILGGNTLFSVHNHHNFAWEETHGKRLWVVRKGATPAFPGQKGFVGGSMGDNAVILEGALTAGVAENLYSTVHGAGRVMSRTQAAGKLSYKKETRGQRSGGQVTQEMMNEWVKKEGVELRGAGTDEAPQCYRRLPEVLDAMGDTIKIKHTLTPVGVAMAGIDTIDPYKD
jgi:tRNA-splicing ligase RtcB